MDVHASKPLQQHGILVLNKPSGPTSAGCLEKIKKQLGQRKIGHAGTLDPMAEGVLIVLLGQGTKLAPYLSEGEKIYSGSLRLGLSTDTYDIQGTVVSEQDCSHVTEAEASEAVESWTDLTEQEVPAYSAAKHKGKPLYALKRAGLDVPVKTKPVRISLAEVSNIDLPGISFRVKCSHGTYVRSLAHSLGTRLGCGAVLTSLLREQSHPFGLDQSHELEEILSDPEGFAQRVIPIARSLPHWRKIPVDSRQAARIKNGMRLRAGETAFPGNVEAGDRAMFMDQGETPLALVETIQDGDELRWTILRGLWAA
jgi:tRNA pseudouridine55 synthase